jgi:hypothetical protein
MKIIDILLVLFVFLLIAIVGYFILSPIKAENIAPFLASTFTGCGRSGQKCCASDWCNVGLICSDNVCVEEIGIEAMVDERYLIYNVSETANRAQREDYFYSKTLDQDCSNTDTCENCTRVFNFTPAKTCSSCDFCDETTSNCDSCLFCDSSDVNGDGNIEYQDLFECFNCSSCTGIDNGMADSCSNCLYCNEANKTVNYESVSSCAKCNECELNPGERCYSCYDCGLPNEDKICDACRRKGSTECKTLNEYEFCKKVKDCILEGAPCEIEELLPLPWDNSYSFNDAVKDILNNCRIEDLEKVLPSGVRQKLCKFRPDMKSVSFVSDGSYVPSLYSMLTFRSMTGENEGILFNDCGNKKISTIPTGNFPMVWYNDPETFHSETTPRTPEGDIPVNLKIVISNVSFNEQTTNECYFDINLCTQESIASSESDSILNFTRLFTYFSESDHSVATKQWNFKFPSLPPEPDYEINVTGIKFNQRFIIDLRTRQADIAHIAKAIIEGLRNYFILNYDVNSTIKFFCDKTGLHPDLDTCYLNKTIVVLNDKMQWNLASLTGSFYSFLNIPDYKYIYYNSVHPLDYKYSGNVPVELTFFAYSSNITGINNTIFVSPMLVVGSYCGDGDIGLGEDCDPNSNLPNNGCSAGKTCQADCKCGNRFEWFSPGECDSGKYSVGSMHYSNSIDGTCDDGNYRSDVVVHDSSGLAYYLAYTTGGVSSAEIGATYVNYQKNVWIWATDSDNTTSVECCSNIYSVGTRCLGYSATPPCIPPTICDGSPDFHGIGFGTFDDTQDEWHVNSYIKDKIRNKWCGGNSNLNCLLCGNTSGGGGGLNYGIWYLCQGNDVVEPDPDQYATGVQNVTTGYETYTYRFDSSTGNSYLDKWVCCSDGNWKKNSC